MHSPSRFFRLGLISASVALGGACAEGAALDDDDTDSIRRTPTDGGAEDAKAPRSDASASSGGASSGGSTSSGGSSGALDAGPDAGPLTACQQALAKILFDVESSTPEELGNDWKVGISDGVTGTWPFQPWVYSTPDTTVIPTACAAGSCIGTSLSQKYAQCQRGWIASPEADLSACAGEDVVVKFDHAYAFNRYDDSGDKDGGIVEVTGNGADFNTATWNLLTADDMLNKVQIRGAALGQSCLSSSSFYVNGKRGYTGTQPTTSTAEIALPASALTAHARIRFLFASGVAYNNTDANTSRGFTQFGWRVDNVRFEQKL